MKNTCRSFFALCLVWSVPAKAFFGDVVTDPLLTGKMIAAEAARLGQTATMIQNQMNQYMQMVRDGMSLADPVFRPLGDTLRSLNNVYMQGQSLMYMAQNADYMFSAQFPSYYTYLGTMGQGQSISERMPVLYKQWSDKGYENTRTAMVAAGMQVENLPSEHAMLQSLVDQSNTAGGQMRVMQAGNQIAASQAEQMLALRQLVAQQTNLHANYMAQQIERNSASDALTENFTRGKITNSPGKGY